MFIFRLIAIFITVLLQLHTVHSLYVYVDRGDTKCISQELDNEDTATFTIGDESESSSNGVQIKLYDASDYVFQEKIIRPSDGHKEFQYNAKERGEHRLCFTPQGKAAPAKLYYDIVFKSRTIRGGLMSAKLSKGELPSVEAQLAVAEESIADIATEIEYARQEEMELRASGEQTSDRIQWFGILSIFVLLTISCWQVLYLRHFFTTKKLL